LTEVMKWTEEEIKQQLEIEKKLIPKYPVALLDRGYLYIKTKNKELIPLKLNTTQQLLLDKILELRKAKKPVRIWVLKFRQGGISTLTEALIYALTSQQANTNSLIMADEMSKSSHLFEMSKLSHEKLVEFQPHLAPTLKKSNAKKLEFEGIHSQIIIESSENVDAANAFTYQYAHLSEVARFRDLKTVLSGLMQTVPKHWDTMVIGETTAQGIDNYFYEEWQKAKAGTSDWIPLFLGWYLMEEYTKPLVNGQMESLEGITYDTDGEEKDFLSEEQFLKKTYSLTDEQLNWRRWMIKNDCQGEVRTFRQEYPADDKEAFLVSGFCVFDKLKLKEQRESAFVKSVGVLYEEEHTGKVLFRKDKGGSFRLFRDIDPKSKIVIGADSSEGIGQDESAAIALDVRTNNTVMSYLGCPDPDLFAQDLALMGKYCNNALICPENNAIGYAVCTSLYKLYKKVYKVTTGQGETLREKLGWTTNERTRREMISHLQTEIREDSTELRDIDGVTQCLSFVRKPNGKIEAQTGKHDDWVMARMIAGEMRILYPFYERSLGGKIDRLRKNDRKRKYGASFGGRSSGY